MCYSYEQCGSGQEQMRRVCTEASVSVRTHRARARQRDEAKQSRAGTAGKRAGEENIF